MPHMTYPHDTMENLKIQHFKPERMSDWAAFWSVQWLFMMIYLMSGFYFRPMNEMKWLRRTFLMETISLIPGMVGSICRYLRTLRLMKRDRGWIHHLLEESDNERFHFFTFLTLYEPGIWMRVFVIFQQATFATLYFIAYLISPRFCHKFHGYLEEAAFKNYTMILHDIDRKGGPLSHWKDRPAGKDAVEYYRFDHTATMRDLVLAIRADEACHQESNHFLGEVEKSCDVEDEKIRIYHDKNEARLKNSV